MVHFITVCSWVCSELEATLTGKRPVCSRGKAGTFPRWDCGGKSRGTPGETSFKWVLGQCAAEAPISKLQAPEKRRTSNPKSQTPNLKKTGSRIGRKPAGTTLDCLARSCGIRIAQPAK